MPTGGHYPLLGWFFVVLVSRLVSHSSSRSYYLFFNYLSYYLYGYPEWTYSRW